MSLLVTALLATSSPFLVVDLTRNLRTVVISDTNKALANAVQELGNSPTRPLERMTCATRSGRRRAAKISYEVLSSTRMRVAICSTTK
jgi:hypothetical protein